MYQETSFLQANEPQPAEGGQRKKVHYRPLDTSIVWCGKPAATRLWSADPKDVTCQKCLTTLTAPDDQRTPTPLPPVASPPPPDAGGTRVISGRRASLPAPDVALASIPELPGRTLDETRPGVQKAVAVLVDVRLCIRCHLPAESPEQIATELAKIGDELDVAIRFPKMGVTTARWWVRLAELMLRGQCRSCAKELRDDEIAAALAEVERDAVSRAVATGLGRVGHA